MASELARVKAHALNQRRKAQELEQGFMRKSMIALTAAATGYAEKKGAPVSVMGVPLKLVIATGASVGEAISKGPARRFLGAIADAELAIYTHDAIKTGGFIAGDDDSVGAGEL
jgi:hypothetical protein